MDNSLFINLTNILTQNPWVKLISIFGAFVAFPSFFLAIYFYLKGKTKKSIKYISRYDTLINEGIDQKVIGLSISISNKQIKRLTVSRIAFWNNGNKTLTYNDIPTLSKFTINIDNKYDILDVSIIETLNTKNNISVNLLEDCKTIEIYFEYMDNNDGFVLQIFHTGNDSSALTLNGGIIGGKISKGIYNQSMERATFFDIGMLVNFIIMLFYMLLSEGLHNKINFIFIIISLIGILVISFKIYYTFFAIPTRIKKYFNKIKL
jgi:hypothetical protein